MTGPLWCQLSPARVCPAQPSFRVSQPARGRQAQEQLQGSGASVQTPASHAQPICLSLRSLLLNKKCHRTPRWPTMLKESSYWQVKQKVNKLA